MHATVVLPVELSVTVRASKGRDLQVGEVVAVQVLGAAKDAVALLALVFLLLSVVREEPSVTIFRNVRLDVDVDFATVQLGLVAEVLFGPRSPRIRVAPLPGFPNYLLRPCPGDKSGVLHVIRVIFFKHVTFG